jgi:hypothetical protein
VLARGIARDQLLALLDDLLVGLRILGRVDSRLAVRARADDVAFLIGHRLLLRRILPLLGLLRFVELLLRVVERVEVRAVAERHQSRNRGGPQNHPLRPHVTHRSSSPSR